MRDITTFNGTRLVTGSPVRTRVRNRAVAALPWSCAGARTPSRPTRSCARCWTQRGERMLRVTEPSVVADRATRWVRHAGLRSAP